jgi:hypothetical protein
MTRKSRNDDALARMRAANPFSAAELRGAVTEAELSLAMQRAIAIGESPTQPIPVDDRSASEGTAHSGGPFARHPGASLGLSLGGLACVAVVAALILLSRAAPSMSSETALTPPSPPPRSRWPNQIHACSSPRLAGRSSMPAASRSTAVN